MPSRNNIYRLKMAGDIWCHCENAKIPKNQRYDINNTCLYCGRQKRDMLMPDSTMAAIREEAMLREVMQNG